MLAAMPHDRRFQPTAADVLVLAAALERDEAMAPAEIAARDHRIAREAGARPGTDLALSRLWLDSVCAQDATLRRLRERASGLLAGAGWLTALVGVVVGWGTALGVFYYDGAGRVNALAVLAAFVLLPAVFLVLFCWSALPPGMLAWLPGAGALASLLSRLSPGRLTGLVVRFLPQATREAWQRLTGRAEATRKVHGVLQKWVFLRWSQLFALAFQAAALTASLGLVVFSDLAFGWSTTLTTGDALEDARRLHAITDVVSAPWHELFAQATPSAELIRDSRYFRVAAAQLTREQAARLGGWWSFVVMAMLVYGLLPRLLTLTFASLRVRSAARSAWLATPGLGPVLRRLHRARVETMAGEPESGSPSLVRPTDESVASALPQTAGAVVNWSAAPIDDRRAAACFGNAAVHHAGGARSPEDDRLLGPRLAEAQDLEAGIVIIVKAWEPPLMELVDFIKGLRSACGDRLSIVVVPIGIAADVGNGKPALPAPEQRHLAVWRSKLATVGDPWLRVAAPSGEGAR